MSHSIAAVLDDVERFALVHADNADVLPQLAAKSVHHVITDPPYSEWVHEKNRRMLAGTNGKGADGVQRTKIGFDALTPREMMAAAEQSARVCSRWVLVFCDVESAANWRLELSASGLEHVRTGAWVKIGGAPQFSGDRPAAGFESVVIAHRKGRKKWNGGGKAAVWTHAIEREAREHTTPKPLPLMLELVELFTDPGDVVLDPFAGSGTTGVACLRLGRRFIGVERDAKYAAVARERLDAEAQGLTLRDARAGQLPLLGVP